MKTQFEASLKNNFKALEFSVFLLLFTIGCMLYFHYSNPFFNRQIFVWLFVIQLTPVLYLHFEYLLFNWGSILIVDKGLGTITYNRNGQDLVNLNFNQIGKIVFYLPPSTYRGVVERKIQFLPIEPYGYATIYSKEADRVLITSLMIPDMLNELGKLENIKIEKKKRLFASPSFEKVIQWFMKDGV